MHIDQLTRISTIVLGVSQFCLSLATSELFAQGHFASWNDVPSLINSITETEFSQQLDKLYELTWIKLGQPQRSGGSKEEQEGYARQTKQNWKQWWESTGKHVSLQRLQEARIDQQAFQLAWEFLGTKQEPPQLISPVWIPKHWTLWVTFTNGDYFGRETEIWIIDRQAESTHLTKLRGDYIKRRWSVVLYQYEGFTPDRADQTLKALYYAHRYAPSDEASALDNELPRLYYPHAEMRLEDSGNRILWNADGYYFCKSLPQFGNGEAGRSYYFLQTILSNQENWREVTNPTSDLLAPYRKFLSFNRPHFSANTDEVVTLFGRLGADHEKKSLLEWAEKQKLATNPNMDWKICYGDFHLGMKTNIINFTRNQIQNTQRELKRLGDRLEKQGGAVDTDKDREAEKELERYIAEMLAIEKREKEEFIESFPQPLRDLIIAHKHPRDSDLKHLSAAIQAIRDNPDPILFNQLVRRMDDGTGTMNSLIKHILLNEFDMLALKPWGQQQQAIAMEACIVALPIANDATDDLIQILLLVCGGGKIEYEAKSGGRSIEVAIAKDGYRMTIGSSSSPQKMDELQRTLRRLFAESKSNSK